MATLYMTGEASFAPEHEPATTALWNAPEHEPATIALWDAPEHEPATTALRN